MSAPKASIFAVANHPAGLANARWLAAHLTKYEVSMHDLAETNPDDVAAAAPTVLLVMAPAMCSAAEIQQLLEFVAAMRAAGYEGYILVIGPLMFNRQYRDRGATRVIDKGASLAAIHSAVKTQTAGACAREER